MQLATGNAEIRPDLPESEARIRALVAELREVSELAARGEEASRTARETEESRYRNKSQARERELSEELQASRSRGERDRLRLDALLEARRARIGRAARRAREILTSRIEEERRRTEAEIGRVHRELDAENARLCDPLEHRLRRWEEVATELAPLHQRAEEAVAWFAFRHGAEPEPADEWAGEIDVGADPDHMADQARGAFEEVLSTVRDESGWWSAGLSRAGFLIVCQAILITVGAVAAVGMVRLGAKPAELMPVAAGFLFLTGVLHLAARSCRGKYRGIARDLHRRTAHEARRFHRHAKGALEDLEARLLDHGEEHLRNLNLAEQRERDSNLSRTGADRRQIDWLDKRKEGAEARMAAKLADRRETRKAEEERRREELETAHAALVEREAEAHRSRLESIEAEAAKRERSLRDRRESVVSDFTDFARRTLESTLRRSLPWDSMDPGGLGSSGGYPGFVPIGRLRLDLPSLLGVDPGLEQSPGEIELPVAATLPEHGSVLVEHAPADRERALAVLRNTILRALTAFPPGKVRLTILDPVGLGQSFSALMHLADHDEKLVNSRIWTETAHIERRLADLSEHIEKVIQKYLRNRFDTIGEYNEEAGDLQEPYHFLVVADFPTAFNDLAAERLASIVSSGPRCGVYTLIARDTRQQVPPPVDLDLLRRNGPAIRLTRDGWRLHGELLEKAAFEPELPPGSEFTNTLLDRIGELSLDASQVELPFAAVAPEDGAIWSGSTETGIRVSIGRTGAERLQYLDLGRGTAQHALVAGRTGSGKSTLFHVMITNMSLWFSPEELQFYLVDFKKGVEFKIFAAHGLPHARVIAIESDREFGLSVLRAVDAELTRRGDLFRGLGVQDLAAYRRKARGEVLPRTLLLIDEFQEFFNDDDAVAHDSAVLLDRFVRQGRAFGIHVVLGSQTLSGIYTLARGTLGQMGVRIALQCNESDSYLILSEDNGVARLLSRPGEAIYNDKSGLLAGNNPFQVVWLPEEEQSRRLRRVSERTAASGRKALLKTTVFEGNQPAEILENAELKDLLASGPAEESAADRVWLGEPNAIKGPTEVEFLPVSGSNLLIVGQRREAAFAMLASSVLSLSARHRPGDLRIAILDGGGNEPEFVRHFEELMEAVPHPVERYDLRTSADAVAELAAVVDARGEVGGDHSPIYVFAFGIQRLRMLRKEDDYSMPFGDTAEESSGDRFDRILTDGPPRRVHTVIWCDTVPNLQRTLSRRTMREFDVRVLFQMSAADSSELIESSAANRLGLNSALMAVESQGTFEKFRPYAIPGKEALRRLGGKEA